MTQLLKILFLGKNQYSKVKAAQASIRVSTVPVSGKHVAYDKQIFISTKLKRWHDGEESKGAAWRGARQCKLRRHSSVFVKTAENLFLLVFSLLENSKWSGFSNEWNVTWRVFDHNALDAWRENLQKQKLKLESQNLPEPLLRRVSNFFRPVPVFWEFKVKLVTGGGGRLCRLGWSRFLLDVARACFQLQETPAFVSCVAQAFLYCYIFCRISHLVFSPD